MSATNRKVPFAVYQFCRGITLVEALVVMVVIGALLAMLIPALRPARAIRSRISCINQIKQIGVAFRLFAIDHQDRFPQQLSTNHGGTLEFEADLLAHLRVLSNELGSPFVLVCPEDAVVPASDFTTLTTTNISYFLGLEADGTRPKLILAGDDNLTTNGMPVGSGWLIPRTNLFVAYGKDRHVEGGNVVMSDGSAQQISSLRLEDYLRRPPNLTNRFLLP
ncbi:MAG: type II secretion system protein [Verrucomicrobiales bacterium]|nr:type II secretion system protein [Verrucomicrobiales bacterium]